MAVIIFDLDGTIADSFEYVAGFLAAQAGLPQLKKTEHAAWRGISMAAMGRRMGLGWLPLLAGFYRGRRSMGKAMKHIRPFAGMPEVLQKVHAEGHELFIVSSNSVRNIHIFLHEHGLHTYFLEAYGGIGMFSKAPALRRLVREHSFAVADCIYIGDELRDVEAAQSVGMRVVAVTWGFARLADLRAQHPSAIAKTPADLLHILEEVG